MRIIFFHGTPPLIPGFRALQKNVYQKYIRDRFLSGNKYRGPQNSFRGALPIGIGGTNNILRILFAEGDYCDIPQQKHRQNRGLSA
jgi:hypothetical protein